MHINACKVKDPKPPLLQYDLADTAPGKNEEGVMPRQVISATVLLLMWYVSQAAGPADALSSKDAAGGMRAAISQGIDKAIGQLGAPNGFLNSPKYAIPLPSGLEKADKALRMIGLSGDADQLKAAMTTRRKWRWPMPSRYSNRRRSA